MIKKNNEIINIDLDSVSKIHMIGIGGISMSGIAVMLKSQGKIVIGSDAKRGPMIEILEQEGIDIFIGSNPERLEGCDLVIYTAAICDSDPEYLKAKELGIPTLERAPFLGILLKEYSKVICVSGMHGKTTTTSIIASAFKSINTNPTVLVGSKLKELDNLNYMIGSKNYFILEACEYVDSFLNFPATTAIILNIEEDHLDYFENLDSIKKSFSKFISIIHKNGNLVICKDDVNCMDILDNLKQELNEKNIRVFTYSEKDKSATIYAENIFLNLNGCYSFDAMVNGNFLDTYQLIVPGKHNVMNCLATIGTVLANEGSEIENIKGSIESFTGASRRFELKKELANKVRIYDDYAHHPTEIKATLKSAKDTGAKRVIAIFEPHTYSRTKSLLKEFSEAFEDADIAIIADIYAAREPNDETISSIMLADKISDNGVNAIYIPTYDKIVEYVKSIIKEGDIILTIGAGTITNLSSML